jgi:hypothetical protein
VLQQQDELLAERNRIDATRAKLGVNSALPMSALSAGVIMTLL